MDSPYNRQEEEEEEEEDEKETKTSKPRLMRQQRYWNALCCADQKQQRKLLKYATPDQVDAMSEVTHNFLDGQVPLSRAQMKQLKLKKNIWRKAGDPKQSQADRHKWIKRGGGQGMSLLVRGLKKGMARGVKRGVKNLKKKYNATTTTATTIQNLENDIERIEQALGNSI